MEAKPTPETDRDSKYLAHVRTLPCLGCGRTEQVQAAHVGGLAAGKGWSRKVSDFRALPLCLDCHGLLDRNEWKPPTWQLELWIADQVLDWLGLSEVRAQRVDDLAAKPQDGRPGGWQGWGV